jgi:tRNA threonylcarbamoyl adenosine modification protein YeaZ
MSLALVVETSSSPFGVVIGTERFCLFDSITDASLHDCRNISYLVELGLSVTNKSVNEIDFVAVNIGPGGLSSVRSGVAFANALAFGLRIPVCPFTSFELIGYEVWQKYGLPIICTARATKGNAYIGLYNNNKITNLRFGLLENIIQELADEMDDFVVAGYHREFIKEKLPDSRIIDSGIQNCQAKTFLNLGYTISERGLSFPKYPIPINEESEEVNECA